MVLCKYVFRIVLLDERLPDLILRFSGLSPCFHNPAEHTGLTLPVPYNPFLSRILRPAMHHATSRTSFLFSIGTLLLAALLLWAPSEAQAQIVFELSERGQKMVTDPDRMHPEDLLKIVGEHGIIIFEGERPVRAKQIVFIVGERGEVQEQIASEPFKLEPGRHRVGEHFPRRQFLALFERMFPDSIFFPDSHFIPGSTWHPEKGFPDSTFREAGLEDKQVGVMMALVPADEELAERVETKGVGLVLSASR